MTGRDLIIYILKNGLEDDPIIKDGSLSGIGFTTARETAAYFNVGEATVKAWYKKGYIEGIEIGGEVYIHKISWGNFLSELTT